MLTADAATQHKDQTRFWSKVDTSGGCWIWKAYTNRGYGQFRLGDRMQIAHRVAWAFCRGEIPAGAFICHTCDNPSCVNPDHLYVGSQESNMQDIQRRKRGHRSSGERWTRRGRNGWDALVSRNGKQVFLGTFRSQKEAHNAAAEFVERELS